MKLDSLKKLKQASVKKTQKTKEKELLARKTIEEEEIETLRSRVTTEAPGMLLLLLLLLLFLQFFHIFYISY